MRKESTVLNTDLWDILPTKTCRSLFFFCMCSSHLSQAREIAPVWGGKLQRNWMLDHSAEQSTAFHLFPLLSRGSQIRNNQNPAGNNIWHLNWVGCTTDVSNVSLSGSFSDCLFFFFKTKNSCTFMVQPFLHHLYYGHRKKLNVSTHCPLKILQDPHLLQAGSVT